MNTENNLPNQPQSASDLLDRISEALSGVRFGSIEIVIQDGRVVQIERKEKFRLDRVSRRIE